MTDQVKVDAEIKILCYPKEGIDRCTTEAFSIRDFYGDLLQSFAGDSTSGYSSDLIPQFDSISWNNQTDFTRLDQNLVFSRLNADGTVSWGTSAQKGKDGIAGFSLKKKLQPFNSKFASKSIYDPISNPTYLDMVWDMVNSKDWEVVSPPETKGSRIFHRQQNADSTVQARTHLSLPAHQGFYITITLLNKSLNQKTDCAYRLIFCDGLYSILLHEKDKPSFQIRTDDGTGWNSFKTFDQLEVIKLEETYTIEVFELAGRFLFGFNGVYFYVTLTDQRDNTETKVATLFSGKVAAQSFGLSFNQEFGLIHFGDLNFIVGTGIARQGSFSRSKLQANRFIGTQTINALVGGSRDNNSKAAALVARNQFGASYTCTLECSPFRKPKGTNFKGFLGCETTPFVTSVLAAYYPQFTLIEREPLDIRYACDTADYTGPQPPNTSGATLELTIDRRRLNNLPMPSDSGTAPTHTSWQEYVKPFNPIVFLSRDIFADGTYGDWETIFIGWQLVDRRESKNVGSNSLSLRCLDEVGRLTSPHSIINRKVPALDWKFNQTRNKVYGYDGIHEILSIFRGIQVADGLNGGNFHIYFSKNHYSIHDPNNNKAAYFPGVEKPPASGFNFLPPYKKDPMSWMKDISIWDHAILYYDRHPTLYPHIPGWIYGRWNYINWGQTAVDLTDQLYGIDANQNKLISELESNALTDKMYNKIEVWGPAASGVAGGFIPAIISEESRLPASDENSEENSWTRELIIQEDFLINRGEGTGRDIARDMAVGAIAPFANRELVYVKSKIYYNTDMMYGKLVSFDLSGVLSDTTINLDAKEFYVVKCMHHWDFGRQQSNGNWCDTTIYCRRTSATDNILI